MRLVNARPLDLNMTTNKIAMQPHEQILEVRQRTNKTNPHVEGPYLVTLADNSYSKEKAPVRTFRFVLEGDPLPEDEQFVYLGSVEWRFNRWYVFEVTRHKEVELEEGGKV